ncbi:immunoglobulin-like domain-containing protein [Saccharothrix coeruleofusca]|uniref:Atrophied bacterial Ig domain-containing protein n=1 Tax=Saccharothrix coeruleofusca TaxID=33919 RepID=A0A918EHL0_9PSEU|nr:LamG-like jellyroll fold domain-containing protein [Saccharothrix coeruleofusca]GGP77422.1 hypothetical protein GCM10010185_58880 [Saccharothrix coeruleofusca]
MACARPRPRPLSAALALALAAAALTTPTASADDALVVHYPLNETTGTAVTDASGSGRTATLVGDAAPSGAQGLRLGGAGGHVKLPDHLLRGLTEVSVSVRVRIAPDQPTPYFIWGLGNSSSSAGNGYLFTTGDGYRTSIATGDWSTEQTTSAGRDLARGVWKTLTYTLGGRTAVLYEDGVEVARRTGVTTTPADIGGGSTTANYLGRSLYSGDRYFKGDLRDFRLYSRVLSASEVRELGVVPDAERARRDADALVVWDADDIRGNITLPAAGPHGTQVTWRSNKPSVITPTGEVRRPAHGTSPERVKLTATVRSGQQQRVRHFETTVRPLPRRQDYQGYLFGYFTGEGTATGEQVHFAASRGDNALKWDELNRGAPVLTSSLGDKGVRDPFVIRSPEGDKFYLIATDLRMYGNGNWDLVQRKGSKHIEVWESTDLVNWSQQRHVRVSPDTAGNTWAPEAYYDESIGAYVVFWASKIYAENDPEHTGNTYNKMLYATTRDFRTFSEPRVWVDPGHSVIDSTVIEHDGVYYRYTKDERSNTSTAPCGKFILAEKSAQLRGTSYDFVADCVGKGAIRQGEGPTVFKSNTGQKWYLFIDEFGGRGYVPFETTDLASGRWTPSTDYQLPSRPRHGTVLPVTAAELDRLRGAFP